MRGCIPQNVLVVKAGKFWVSVLAGCVALLAGCSTTPHGGTDSAAFAPPPMETAVVAEDSPLATPPAEVPPATPAPPVARPQPQTAPPVAPAPAPVFPRPAWTTVEAWTRSKGLPAPRRRPQDAQPTYEVATPAGVWVVRPGTEITLWNDVQLRLGFPPKQTGAGPLVNTLDLEKTVEPLLRAHATAAAPRPPVIVLDPGHGGVDSGTSCVLPGKFEKDFTLDWALRLRALLVARGYDARLTRTNDCDLPIAARVAFADQAKADLFISLHFNSAGTKRGEAGLETYCLTPAGLPSNLSRGVVEDVRAVFPNNAYDELNLKLALGLHRSLLQTSGATDRGVRRARFPGVLRGQQRPAVLIEGGYLSNPREAGLIATAAYRQQLAESLAKALQDWVGKGAPSLAAANPQ